MRDVVSEDWRHIHSRLEKYKEGRLKSGKVKYKVI